MSAIDPERKKPAVYQPVRLFSTATFVDTNSLLQKAIQKLPSEVRSGIILRCDELAALQVDEENIENAFTRLLELIVQEKQAGAALYLHITCAKENKSAKATTGNTAQRYTIRFHANLTPHAAWMQKTEQRINSIAALLLPYNGSLQVNQLKNSGCVFCITLPGK